MEQGTKVTDPEKLMLLYERFRDVCWVEKEVWKEIFMPREVSAGPVRTNVQDRYEVRISDPTIEQIIESNISYGVAALGAVFKETPGPYFIYQETVLKLFQRRNPNLNRRVCRKQAHESTGFPGDLHGS
jgi:hypothetical protein